MNQEHLLVRDYQKGNQNSFTELYKKAYPQVFIQVYKIVKDREAAEDLTQEAFIKASSVILRGKYKEQGKFASWVSFIGRNLAIDYYRNKKRNKVDSFEDLSHLEMEVDEVLSEEDLIMKREFERYVVSLMDQIPAEQREVLRKRLFDGLSFKEINEEMGSGSINTTLGRMRYALISMRKLMGLEPNVRLRAWSKKKQ